MEAVAKTKYLKGSPRKTRLVIDMIRGENVSRALAILKFTDRRAADPIEKTLRSAIANATYQAEQQNIAVDPDDLWVRKCFVDMGPTKHRRRMRPAPQGRAYREQRHYCHITIEVTSDDKPKTEKELRAEAARAKAETGKAKAKSSKSEGAAPKAAKKAKTEATESTDDVKTATNVEETHEEQIAESVEAAEIKADAEIADAKNAQTAAEAHSKESKPADAKQVDINEDLERQ